MTENIYEVPVDIRALSDAFSEEVARCEEAGIDWETDPAAILAYEILSQAQENADQQAYNCMLLAREKDMDADMVKAEIARLTAMKRRYERHADALRGVALEVMKVADVLKVKGVYGTLSRRQTAGKVSILNPSALPPQCFKEPEVSLSTVKKLVEEGVIDQSVAIIVKSETVAFR